MSLFKPQSFMSSCYLCSRGELTFFTTDLKAKVDPKGLKLPAGFLQNWSIVLLLSITMH